MKFILWLFPSVLVIAGIVQLFQGQILLAVLLIALGLAAGPGGFTIFKSRSNRVGTHH